MTSTLPCDNDQTGILDILEKCLSIYQQQIFTARGEPFHCFCTIVLYSFGHACNSQIKQRKTFHIDYVILRIRYPYLVQMDIYNIRGFKLPVTRMYVQQLLQTNKEQCKYVAFDSFDRPSNLNLDQIIAFLSHIIFKFDMTLNNNMTPLLCHFKFCASFQT